jgi:hypothetical protein
MRDKSGSWDKTLQERTIQTTIGQALRAQYGVSQGAAPQIFDASDTTWRNRKTRSAALPQAKAEAKAEAETKSPMTREAGLADGQFSESRFRV